MKYRFLVVFTCIVSSLFAQNNTVDSLNTLLHSAQEDTTKLRLYFELAYACDIEDNLKYAEPAITLIDKLTLKTSNENLKKELLKKKSEAYDFIVFYYQKKDDDKKQQEYAQKKLIVCYQLKDSACILYTHMNLAAHFRRQGNLPLALEFYQKGLDACYALNYKEGIARSQVEIADMYVDQGDTVQAIALYKSVLYIVYEMQNDNLLARAIMQTGGFYNAIGNYTTALKYYDKAREMFEVMKDTFGLMEIYKNSGDTYNEKKDFDKSINDYKIAIQFAEYLKKPVAVVNYMGRMANVYANKSDYKNAINCINEALQYNLEHIEQGTMQIWLKSKLARIYYKQKEYRKAKQYSDLTLESMKAVNEATIDMELENLASKIDSACGNYKEAYLHYQEYILLRDKLNSDEVRKAATQERYQNEFNKQKAIDQAEQDKKDILADEEKRKQKVIMYSVSGVLTLVLLFSIFIFRTLRITRKQKNIIELKEKETQIQKILIEEKHKEITDSINYAERIQKSFLATQELLNENLTSSSGRDYFILFQPKDIVSGDFYWAAKLNNTQFALVIADSTGHGVPGAIMSLLNITSLEKAIEHFSSPAEILNETRKIIINRLKKDGSPEGGKDGMDCSLLSFDFKNNKLTYAAANNPVWLIRNNTLLEFNPDKMPVGKHDRDTIPFQQHEIELQKGDIIYAITDGMPDQFGGEFGKKFKYKPLKELLISIAHLPLSEQKISIHNSLKSWKGDLEQVDDVTLVGIRI